MILRIVTAPATRKAEIQPVSPPTIPRGTQSRELNWTNSKMNKPLPTMFANTSIAFTQQEEHDGLLKNEFATERGAMLSFEASHLTFAEEFFNDFNDLDDSDDEDNTATSTNTAKFNRVYARIESRLVRKHIVSGALSCAPFSPTSAHKAPKYQFTSTTKNLGLYDFTGPDASGLTTKNTTPTAPTTNHRRANSCSTTDLSERIVDHIAIPPTANESAGLKRGVVVSEMKKSAKDKARAA